MIVMDDKTNILLVDTHAESIGTADDVYFSIHEKLLNSMTFGSAKSPMVGIRRNIIATQLFGQSLCFGTSCHVDNARSPLFTVAQNLLNYLNGAFLPLGRT